jgi:hypothetical protein
MPPFTPDYELRPTGRRAAPAACFTALFLVGGAQAVLIYLTYPMVLLPPVVAIIANFAVVTYLVPSTASPDAKWTAIVASFAACLLGWLAGMGWAMNTYGT